MGEERGVLIGGRELSDGDLLSVAEAAEFLGIAKQTLNNWRHLRRGPAYVKFSERKVKYLVRDLLEFRDRKRIDPETRRIDAEAALFEKQLEG